MKRALTQPFALVAAVVVTAATIGFITVTSGPMLSFRLGPGI